MPNRIIKESICTSENIDQLSAFQETVFYRLIVNCDDYGRLDARPKLLASKLFPLKDIRASQIEDALQALTSAELIDLYTVDGKSFLQMKTWDRHQTIRAKKSRYPSPSENICKQMQADASKCPRNPIQSESESKSESNPNPNPAKADDRAAMKERFDRFWTSYPRKTAKQDAAKAFARLNPDAALLDTMLSALEKQKQSAQWTRDGGQYIPHPATWLNGKRWTDEVTQPRAAPPKAVSAQQYDQREYVNAPAEEMPPWLVKNLANDPAFLAEHPNFLNEHPEAKEYIA